MASMHDSVRFKTTVYAAIELSKKSWVVAIARPDRDRPSIIGSPVAIWLI
jgi:hypothetical protein